LRGKVVCTRIDDVGQVLTGGGDDDNETDAEDRTRRSSARSSRGATAPAWVNPAQAPYYAPPGYGNSYSPTPYGYYPPPSYYRGY
jgi:hypothetical protein